MKITTLYGYQYVGWSYGYRPISTSKHVQTMLKIYDDTSLRFIVFKELIKNEICMVVNNGSSEKETHGEMKTLILNTLKNPNLKQIAAGYINLTIGYIYYSTSSTKPERPEDEDTANELIEAIREKLVELDIFKPVRE